MSHQDPATAGVLELCVYKLCCKPVKNSQMIQGEFFTALDASPLCVFLHILCVDSPRAFPMCWTHGSLKADLHGQIVYCWLQCRYSVM